MSKAKKQQSAEPPKAEAVLDIPVEFGNVSIGDGVARLGMKVVKERLSVTKAEKTLVARRLAGKVIMLPPDSDPKQAYFEGMDVTCEVDGVFDSAGYRSSEKHISFGVSFSRREIDTNTLADFARHSGRFVAFSADEIPDDEKDGSDDGDLEGQTYLVAQGPWADFPINKLQISDGTIKCCAKAEIKTMGDLAKWSRDGKGVRDIPGLGEVKAQRLEDATLEFWRQNPQAAEEAAKG